MGHRRANRISSTTADGARGLVYISSNCVACPPVPAVSIEFPLVCGRFDHWVGREQLLEMTPENIEYAQKLQDSDQIQPQVTTDIPVSFN